MVLNTSFNVKGQPIVNTPARGGRDLPRNRDGFVSSSGIDWWSAAVPEEAQASRGARLELMTMLLGGRRRAGVPVRPLRWPRDGLREPGSRRRDDAVLRTPRGSSDPLPRDLRTRPGVHRRPAHPRHLARRRPVARQLPAARHQPDARRRGDGVGDRARAARAGGHRALRRQPRQRRTPKSTWCGSATCARSCRCAHSSCRSSSSACAGPACTPRSRRLSTTRPPLRCSRSRRSAARSWRSGSSGATATSWRRWTAPSSSAPRPRSSAG